MATVSGSKTNAIIQIATTWGTAVDGGAGDKLTGCEITPNFNVEELLPRQIGSGRSMVTTATRGNFKPTWGLAMDAGYRNTMDVLIAQFFGTSGAPAEQTGGQADYLHTITYNSTINSKYLTLAYDTSSATVIEMPTGVVRSLGFSLEDAPGLFQFTCELLGNTATTTGTTNTNADLAAATATDTERIAYAVEDTFRINLNSGGALAGGDQYNIVGYDLQMERPQEIIGEIRGAAGNSTPIETGLFNGNLNLAVKELADHAYFTYWAAETALKCSLNIQGTQIGSGVNKAITINLPKMVQVTEPVYALTSEGINSLALSFRLLEATANPTGMSSTFPYVTIINGLSTSLLA